METQPLLYNLQPTAAQIRTTSLAALLLLVGFLAVFPFRELSLAKVDAFTPVINTALLLGDLITATLLLAQALVLRSKALMALGTGYFFTGLMIIPHGLTFPGAFSPTGLLGAGLSTTTWLYNFWHCGLPVAVIAYTVLKKSSDWPHRGSLPPYKVIAICLISATALAGALTVLATVGEPLLPRMMLDAVHGYAKKHVSPTYPVMLLVAAAMVITWRGRSSPLDLWLLLALWAWFLELLLSAAAHSRFDLGWYSGRILGLLSGLFVLLMFLAQTSRLYAQAVLQVRARQWEQDNRLAVRDVIAASIAHELRQPLAAIMLNAQTARQHVPEPDNSMTSILDDILSDSRRANDIMEGARAIFGQTTTQRSPANMNRLVRDTLVLIFRDLRVRGVSVNLQLDESLRPIAVNRLQMEQVFYNLFTNAAEAMSAVRDRPRILTIRSGSDEKGLLICVEDTGPGISAADQERIFETSYTTKAHGMGLGLSICRSVVNAHGGQISIAASVPTGVTIEIRLPYCGSTEIAA